MVWTPYTEEEILQEISDSCDRMSLDERKLWEVIKVQPAKWQLSPWGDEGQGFWVVAIVGSFVIWYNDIEHGFNLSEYSQHGCIGEYWCNQDGLDWVILRILPRFKKAKPADDHD